MKARNNAIMVTATITLSILLVASGYWIASRPATQPVAKDRRPTVTSPAPQFSKAVPHDRSPLRFTSMSAQSGIDFLYYGSPTRAAHMTEQNGGGIALLDYDLDGEPDQFFVNGSNFDVPATGLAQSNRLYRATGPFLYADVTTATGLEAQGFGMGVAAADYDNDGFTDLFVAAYGRDRLWRNNGDGTFAEVTAAAGVGSELWGSSAAWADLDGDGLLDLYVTNYVKWSPDEPTCHPDGHPEINTVCSPMERPGQADLLYRNLGDGRFEEVGTQAGIARPEGKGLALEIADFDGDGRLDIFVVNDTTQNFLYHNLGDLRFEDMAVPRGVAVGGDGTIGSGMGVACADFDHNGNLDLCVTNFRNQVNFVFANLGPSGFVPVNTRLGIDLVSRSPLGFGIVLADFDLDTWPDMFVANGHIWDLTALGQQYEYQMQPQVLWNRGGQRFEDVSATAGDYFQSRWLGRAVAVGDLDNDGDPDLVVSHLEAPPAILRNDSNRTGKSVRLRLVGTRSSRQPLGATVTYTVGGSRLVTHVPSGGSFQATHADTLILSGTVTEISEVNVAWPGGSKEVWQHLAPDARGDVLLIEGTGNPLDSKSPVATPPKLP